MIEKLVTIAAYSDPIEANLARIKIENEGIDCFLAGENAVAVYGGAVGEIKLQVRQKDAVLGIEILKRPQEQAENFEDPDEL